MTTITKAGKLLYLDMLNSFASDDYPQYKAMELCSLLMRSGKSYFHISEMQCNAPDIPYYLYEKWGYSTEQINKISGEIGDKYYAYWDKKDVEVQARIVKYVKELAELTNTDIIIEWNMGVSLHIGNKIFYLVE